MTRAAPGPAASLKKRRRLTKEDIEVLQSGATDSPFSRAQGWLKDEAERHLQLRVLALEHYGIDDTQPNWRDRYIHIWKSGRFRLSSSTSFRPADEEREIDPLVIVTRLSF